MNKEVHERRPLLLEIAAAVTLSTCEGAHLDFHGFSRVRTSVARELLPRQEPACFTDDELAEFERRLWALGLFDDVAVEREGGSVHVRVQEKWTLVVIPEVGLGRRLRDSYGAITVTEANVAGRAIECGAWAAYYERAWTGQGWCGEHQGHASRFSLEVSGGYTGSSYAFEGSSWAWENRGIGGSLGVRLPFRYGTQWRLALLTEGYHERVVGEIPSKLPREGVQVGFGLRGIWDALSWNDLTPRGHRFAVTAMPGLFLTEGGYRPRHALSAQWLSAFAPGARTALLANGVVEAAAPGDPNHSFLIGSVPSWRSFAIGGIRGLTDNLYRDAFHAFGNLEGRQAFPSAVAGICRLHVFWTRASSPQ